MLKKITISLITTSSMLISMSLSQINEASKTGLGCIKGVGEKRLQLIIEYKKEHKIKTIDELLNIRGVGKVILNNIKEDILKKSCRKEKRASTSKKINRPHKKIDAE